MNYIPPFVGSQSLAQLLKCVKQKIVSEIITLPIRFMKGCYLSYFLTGCCNLTMHNSVTRENIVCSTTTPISELVLVFFNVANVAQVGHQMSHT